MDVETTRLLRDIEDGIVLIDNDGTVTEMNPSARKLLGLEKNFKGRKYSEIMQKGASSVNDGFYQMVIDTLYDKKRVHRKEVSYLCPDGTERFFDVRSSILLDDDENEMDGICLSFSDITDEMLLSKQVSDSAKSFILLLGVMIVWCFIVALWDYTGQLVTSATMSKILTFGALIPALWFMKSQHLSPSDVGLAYRNIGKSVAMDCVLTLAAATLLVIIKLIVLQVSPDYFQGPFLNFDKYPVEEYIAYGISVVVQEFISRGMVHESLRHIIPGKYSEVIAIIGSSLYFGALHIHLGLIYMLAASALLGIFGVLYVKQNTIWGLCIPHYVLGLLIGILGFVAY